MPNPRKTARTPLTWILTLTLLYLLILASRPSEAFFGVPGEWTWSGRPPSPATYSRWWPAVLALAITATGVLILDRRWAKLTHRQRAAALLFLIVAIPTIQIALKYIHYRDPIEFYLYRTTGPHNGFWQTAVTIESLQNYLRTYPEQMRLADDVFGHLTTHPPGNILYLYLWRRAFEALPGLARTAAHWLRAYNCTDIAFVSRPDAHIAAALGQMTIPLLSGLTLIPLYTWAKQLSEDTRTAWRAAALFALTPALSLFTMRWDTLYPFFAATAFATLHRGLTENKARWWLLSGVTVSVASFCSFGNAPLAPAVALYAALFPWRRGPRHILHAWRQWLALIAGGYSVWGLFHLTTGVAFWDLLAITGSIQATLRSNYSYGRWLFYNAYDILTFAGVPTGILFITAAARAWKNVARRTITRTALPALVISAVLALVDLAGVSPGEVGRLWLYWTVGMAIAVALLSDQPSATSHQPLPSTIQRATGNGQRKTGNFPIILALLALQSLWMTLFLRVSPTGMPSYVSRHPENSAIATPTDVTFANNIHLIGYDITPTAVRTTGESSLTVTLDWQAATRPDLPYTVFVHLIHANGTLIAQHDAMPAANTLPTSCWLPGEIIEDVHPIDIPADTPPGDYTVHVGLYDLSTLERLPIISGSEGDFFRLPRTIVVTP